MFKTSLVMLSLRNDEVRWTTKQWHVSAVVQAWRLPVQAHWWNRCQEDLNSSSLENWRRPSGRPRTTWMKTIQQDPKSNNLSLYEAIDMAQNRPLWRLMSTFGAMQS